MHDRRAGGATLEWLGARRCAADSDGLGSNAQMARPGQAGADVPAARARLAAARRTKGAAVVLVAASLASGVAVGAAAGHPREGSGAPQPRVIQLSYSEVNDGTFPRTRLMAFARRTDSVKLATRFNGRHPTADTRLDKSITDTDIKGNAKHPFVVIRKGGGRRVVKLVRKSLAERGQARVRVRAERDGRVDAIKLRIVLARCAMDPPLFPVDCEVKRSGKHV